ncbi:MAG TPA: hypothetical protein VK922_04395 [Gemmatimonadaceae bacterium]|nr:hypothetical protein [Gemmatimonadaceae bacterium]
MPIRILWAIALVAVLLAPDARAQALDVSDAQRRTLPSRWFGSFSLLAAQPLGEFNDYIDVGGGLAAGLIYQVSPTSPIAIRADVGYVLYGSEKKRIHPFPRLEGDITTNNSIVYAAIGPQIMVPDGLLRPYIGGSIGLSYFFTQSSLDGITSGSDAILETTNFDDVTFAWTGAGGVYIPLRRGLKPISLDIGARYHGNGRARYLREGSIQDNPDNSITVTPIESETNLVTWHLGITVGF